MWGYGLMPCGNGGLHKRQCTKERAAKICSTHELKKKEHPQLLQMLHKLQMLICCPLFLGSNLQSVYFKKQSPEKVVCRPSAVVL